MPGAMPPLPQESQPGPSAPAPGAPPAQGSAPQGGGVKEVVSSIHNGLTSLMDAMAQSPAVDDSDRQQLASLIQQFEAFIDGLGSGKKPQAGAGIEPAQ